MHSLAQVGNLSRAIELYKRSFHLWPELDSGLEDGIPRGVLRRAAEDGIDCDTLGHVPLALDAPPRFAREDTAAWLAYLEEHGSRGEQSGGFISIAHSGGFSSNSSRF